MTPARLLAVVWTLGILAACSIPGQDLPKVDVASFDKVVHFAVFAGYGCLWMWALRGPRSRRAAWVIGTGTAYGVLTEIYQGLLPFDRSPDPFDALADILGVVVAVVILLAFRRPSHLDPKS